ncbi:hypothetical protein ACWOFR_03625 [Carnobacterium gallinarum]|uniref:hypothetical protein n=1 Tax=Carnobacterium gallinarum TaxID=2749 RepID=UPI000558A58E|nr:hypothetical protein [Carnobacterium gallinarum]
MSTQLFQMIFSGATLFFMLSCVSITLTISIRKSLFFGDDIYFKNFLGILFIGIFAVCTLGYQLLQSKDIVSQIIFGVMLVISFISVISVFIVGLKKHITNKECLIVKIDNELCCITNIRKEIIVAHYFSEGKQMNICRPYSLLYKEKVFEYMSEKEFNKQYGGEAE